MLNKLSKKQDLNFERSEFANFAQCSYDLDRVNAEAIQIVKKIGGDGIMFYSPLLIRSQKEQINNFKKAGYDKVIFLMTNPLASFVSSIDQSSKTFADYEYRKIVEQFIMSPISQFYYDEIILKFDHIYGDSLIKIICDSIEVNQEEIFKLMRKVINKDMTIRKVRDLRESNTDLIADLTEREVISSDSAAIFRKLKDMKLLYSLRQLVVRYNAANLATPPYSIL